MREIKFRAWDTEEKAMFLDFSADTDDFTTLLNETIKYLIENNNLKIMQYTGLKDKNGKEIYEGDKISFTVFDYNDNDSQFNGIVKFAEGKWQLWFSNESEFYGSDGAFDLFGVHSHDCEIEVTGNIYENPELLEVKS